MMKKTVSNIIHTPNAILHKFGLQVFEAIKKDLEEGHEVELSFEGIKNLTTGFCHASIGNVYAAFPNKASSLLKLSNLPDDPDWNQKIKEAIEFAMDPKKAQSNDQAITELFN